MSKSETIERIQQATPGVKAAFLADFDEAELDSYLRRLTEVLGHRGPGSVWVREPNTPAVFAGPDRLAA